MDIPITDLDFRLLDIDLELFALDYYLNLIEEKVRNKEADERLKSQQRIKNSNLTPDDLEWQEQQHELNYIVDFLLPRIFRSPFLVSLYAVYESAVTEIAKLMQEKRGIAISIKDLKGDFPDRANKYYNHVITFPLCTIKLEWDRIKMLSDLRNAIAHANGRIEMLKPVTKKKITNWEKQKIGISSINGFIVIGEGFLIDTFSLVRTSINDLVERFKKWDDSQTSAECSLARRGKKSPPP